MTFPTRVAACLLVFMTATTMTAPAAAATSEVSPTGFIVSLRYDVNATPHRVWESLGEIGKWWNSSHTWSGNAANLSLPMQASGCYCERWGANSVEHGRVVFAAEDSVLRLQAALGPLQALAVNAVLTFAITQEDGKTVLQVTYRVSGNASAALQDLAGPVDGVIAEQARRLVAYAESGKPE